MKGWVAVGLVVFASAACGPSWRVRTQAAPNPFLGVTSFSVAPVGFAGLRVGELQEADYLEGKEDAERASWKGAKDALDAAFAGGFTSAASTFGVAEPPGAPFRLTAAVVWIDPGLYAPPAARASRVKMLVTIAVKNGGPVVDAIEIEHGTFASATFATPESRLKADGAELGALAAEYLRTRVLPESK